MIKFALLGVGRIGKMHAQNIILNPRSNLEIIYDSNTNLAKQVANSYDCKVANSSEEAINSNVDAVLIATSTPTHIEYILKSAEAGKAIFCEKPIDLDITKVNRCKKKLEKFNVPIQLGFNRRFDFSHRKLKEEKNKGNIGNLEMIIISSRDPEPPSFEYLKESGGLFKDMTIHDFDMLSYILGDDPIIEITANSSVLFSNAAKKANDFDTAMFLAKSKSGILCHINNSRRAVYGYDQRIEIYGSKGMLISDNQSPTSVKKFNEFITSAEDPSYHFFAERYEQAFRDQLDSFINALTEGKSPEVGFDDGRNALILANAAYDSFYSKKTMFVNYELR